MTNYSNGKIYKIEPIVEHDEGDIYIGSTTKKYLSQRIDTHRQDYKRFKNNKKKNNCSLYQLFDKYGVENCDITLIEYIDACSKDELLSHEKKHIKNMKCINTKISFENPTNHEIEPEVETTIFNCASTLTICECGKVLKKDKLLDHLKTDSHKKKLYAKQAIETIISSSSIQMIYCKCGASVRKEGFHIHLKSQIHKKYMRNQQEQTINNQSSTNQN